MNALTAPKSVREAVDHARLLIKIKDQIIDCLAGRRSEVFITFNGAMICSWQNSARIAEVIENWMIDAHPEIVTDFLMSLDDAKLRARMKTLRNDLIREIADATLSTLTIEQVERLRCEI